MLQYQCSAPGSTVVRQSERYQRSHSLFETFMTTTSDYITKPARVVTRCSHDAGKVVEGRTAFRAFCHLDTSSNSALYRCEAFSALSTYLYFSQSRGSLGVFDFLLPEAPSFVVALGEGVPPVECGPSLLFSCPSSQQTSSTVMP